MSDWTEVETALPPPRNDGYVSSVVLVFVPKWDTKDYAPIRLGYYIHGSLNQWRIEGSPSNFTDSVTHWMPLPEKPVPVLPSLPPQ
jgi:hypothetical protein